MSNLSNTYQDIPVINSPSAPTTNYQRLYGKNTGYLYSKDSTNVETELRNPVTFYRLAANFTSTSTTRVNVTGLSFPITAGKSYQIKLLATYQSNILTNGASIGVVLASGAVSSVHGRFFGAVSQATVATELNSPFRGLSTVNTLAGSFMTTSSVSIVNSPHHIGLDGIIHCSTSGVCNIQFGAEVALNTSTLLAGSTLIITQLN